VLAAYLVETSTSLGRAAEVMAGEASTGTFVQLPDETPELRAHTGVRVESIDALEGRAGIERGLLTLSIPPDLIGGDLTTLLACVAGNIAETKECAALRLVDLHLPVGLVDACAGPRYGTGGTRAITGVAARPLRAAVLSDAPHLSLDQTIARVRRLVEDGADIVLDGAPLADPRLAAAAERVPALLRVTEELADRTGRRALFAFDVTDGATAMVGHAERVRAAGAMCVQVRLARVGIAALGLLRRSVDISLHGHSGGLSMLSRSARWGIDFVPWQKLWRLAGVDQIRLQAPYDPARAGEATRHARACLAPLGAGGPTALPVVAVTSPDVTSTALAAAVESSDVIRMSAA
jgi:ribulose-bisphosphate carboxylase large chain